VASLSSIRSSSIPTSYAPNPAEVLNEAAAVYKVDTDAIAIKVKQEFAAKAKAKKSAQPAPKVAKKAA
jgi:ParB family transcriptional regulator, chromosome partitioning protein